MVDIKDSLMRFSDGSISGTEVEKSSRTIGEIRSIFENPEDVTPEMAERTAYYVECYLPEDEGTKGGLYFGVTRIEPELVGDEYIMTKGHFHANIDTAEFYWGIEGEGVLILMDEERNVWGERMVPGSLHYIPGRIAHRVANTGETPLVFGACWPSDAGHDYGTIEKEGFAARLKKADGKPKFVKR